MLGYNLKKQASASKRMPEGHKDVATQDDAWLVFVLMLENYISFSSRLRMMVLRTATAPAAAAPTSPTIAPANNGLFS